MRRSLSSNPALSAGCFPHLILQLQRHCLSFMLNNQLSTQLLHACPESLIGFNIVSYRISHQQVSEEFCGYIWPTPNHTAIGWWPASDRTTTDGRCIFVDVCTILAPAPIHLPRMGYFALKR
jgi:hypothetical protein